MRTYLSSFTTYISVNKPDWTLLALRLYTYASSFLQVVFNQSVKSTKFLMDSFKDDIYMFMNGSFAPVQSRNYSLNKTGSSVPIAFYNRETKTLSRAYPGTTMNNHTLDIYTAQLFHGDMMIYDLTDFFETTFFAEQDNIPELSVWLGAWSLENRIYLDPNVNYIIKFTTLENQNNEFSIWTKDENDSQRWQQMNQAVPRLHRQSRSAAAPVTEQPEPAPPAQEASVPAPAPASAPAPFDEHKTNPFYEQPLATNTTPEPLNGGSNAVKEVEAANA